MKITVLGATGATGSQVVDRAVAAGHEVTVLVRNPATITRTDVRVVGGDATAVDDVKVAIAGADVVLSALGAGNSLKSDIASRSAAALLSAADATGVSRVVVLSAFGVGESRTRASFLQKAVFRLVMNGLFADKAVADDLLRRSDLDWTLVYPVTLSDGPPTGTATASEQPAISGLPKISRADVAAFMVAQIGSDEWSRRTAVLTPSGEHNKY